MDRTAWLRERRAAVEADYDRDAPTYDQDPYPVEVHVVFVDRLLATCPAGGLVLDAPCGLSAQGLPVVRGEVVEGDTGGYHLSPGREHALRWIADAGFDLITQDADRRGEWGYRHLLLRATA